MRKKKNIEPEVAPEPEPHVHIWDVNPPVHRDRTDLLDGHGEVVGAIFEELWNGPLECSCGMSRWMTDGLAGPQPEPVEEPHDPVIRLMEYKAKMDAGEELTEEEIADLRAIGESIAAALKPLWEALMKMVDDVVKALTPFIELFSQDQAQLITAVTEASEQHIPPTATGAIDIVDGETLVGRIPLMGGIPVPSLSHIALDNTAELSMPTHEPKAMRDGWEL